MCFTLQQDILQLLNPRLQSRSVVVILGQRSSVTVESPTGAIGGVTTKLERLATAILLMLSNGVIM